MEIKNYKILYSDKVVGEDIPSLPKSIKGRVKEAVEFRLTSSPISYGRPLKYSYKGYRRIRVGDYRIIYRVDEKKNEVLVVAIAHRKDVYE